ncbi:MAG TPA: hypothetical protein VGG96_02505 [Steroidobacteraceae bacterium]|jgi:hypothetical protein
MSTRPRALRLRCATFGIVAIVATTSPCLASGSLSALLACRSIAATAARLACFDRESGALAAERIPAGTHTELNARETFGLAPLQVAARAEAAVHAPKPLDSLTVRISSVARAADGREIFTLDNHQIWVQLLSDGDWLDASTGDQVTISRGWLDSYWLRLPSHRGFKVRRVR